MAKGVKTGGRKAGTPNKATADVKALAGQYGAAAIERLAVLMAKAESEAAQVAACKEILDRAYGKSAQPLTGDPNNPIAVADVSDTEVARRLALMLTNATK